MLLAIGFVIERTWLTFTAPRALETIVLAGIALSLAWMLSRLSRWRMATSLAVIFTAALIVYAGPLQVAAVVVLAASAACIGAAIARDRANPLTILLGLSVLTGVLGWLLPFPIHYRIVYVVLLGVPIVLCRRRLIDDTRQLIHAWRRAVGDTPHSAAFAVAVVGLCSTGCWFPTFQHDDLAYHLGLPSQLSALHYYRLDVDSQFWAVAPWAGDIAHAIAQMVAGREARGAVDALWLLTIATFVWRACRLLGASPMTRWLAVALVASQPLLAVLCGGMQAELPATAAALALVVIVLDRDDTSRIRDALCFACAAALLLGLKTGFVAIVLPLAVAFAWTRRARGFSMRSMGAVAAFLLLSGSSYFYATLLTGDPFYPLLAAAFHAYATPDVNDLRWHANLGLSAVWALTFNTGAFHEGWDGAAGFSLLALAGASVVALLTKRTRAIALCAALSFIAAIVTVHYFRYTFPATVMLIAPSMTALARTLTARRTMALSCALIAVNLAYQSCASWILHVGGIKKRTHHSDVVLLDRFAPTRDLVDSVDAGAIVLFCSPSDATNAGLAGRGLTVAHYDLELTRDREAADADMTGTAWHRIFEKTQASYAIVSLEGAPDPALTAALADAHLVREQSSRQLWRLPVQSPQADDFLRARDEARKRFWP